jgi:hypothetical protein
MTVAMMGGTDRMRTSFAIQSSARETFFSDI